MRSAQFGFAPIVVIIISLLALSTVAFYINNRTNFSVSSPSPSPTISPAPTHSPTPSPTPTPTPTPTPSLTSTPTAIPTPKPTSAPPITTSIPTNGYSNTAINTSRGSFNAQVLILNNPKMFTDTASDGSCDNDCPVKSLADYATQNGAFAAVNGTYFCPDTYPDCQSKKNSFDFPVYNSRLNHWINEDKLFWDNRALIYQDGGGYHFVKNAKDYHGSPMAGITNYPALLDNGNSVVNDYSLSDKQRARGTKVGLGLSGDKVYIVIAQNVDMEDFAQVFKNLGALSALNLDTGGSTAFWYGGRYLAGPGRNLPNAVLFK